MTRFQDALPELCRTLEGRWVVFRDGAVQSDHDTESAAYADAIKHFGPRGGFVVAEVKAIVPIPLTAGAFFVGAP